MPHRSNCRPRGKCQAARSCPLRRPCGTLDGSAEYRRPACAPGAPTSDERMEEKMQDGMRGLLMTLATLSAVARLTLGGASARPFTEPPPQRRAALPQRAALEPRDP